jgi:hypothetical protein
MRYLQLDATTITRWKRKKLLAPIHECCQISGESAWPYASSVPVAYRALRSPAGSRACFVDDAGYQERTTARVAHGVGQSALRALHKDPGDPRRTTRLSESTRTVRLALPRLYSRYTRGRSRRRRLSYRMHQEAIDKRRKPLNVRYSVTQRAACTISSG